MNASQYYLRVIFLVLPEGKEIHFRARKKITFDFQIKSKIKKSLDFWLFLSSSHVS